MEFLRAAVDVVCGQYTFPKAMKVPHSVPSRVGGEKVLNGLDTVSFEPVVWTSCENAHERDKIHNKNNTHIGPASPSKLGPVPAFAS